MSKLITQRFEYAIYDDTTGNLTALPPTYPTVLDNFCTETVSSAAQSYGIANLGATNSGGNQPIITPPGATVVVAASPSNTTNIIVKTSGSTALVPNGTAQQLFWTVMPGQTVTVPGCWNTAAAPLIVFPVDTTNSATTTTWAASAMWSV